MDPFVDDGHEDNAESSLFHDDMDTGDGASPRMDTAKGGHDKKAVLWHVDSLKLKSASGEHSSLIADVRFSPSMPCLATSSFDKTVRVWDVDSVWLVGDGVTDDEQKKAAKGVHFIPFSQFPPKIVRKDCFYHSTPALTTPKD